jgi:hypothetical protein
MVPLVGAVVVAALPLIRYVKKTTAEAAAADFLHHVQVAQQTFRSTQPGAGYASSLDSLTRPCPGAAQAMLIGDEIRLLEQSGYAAQLRAAAGATSSAVDCHGRAIVSDYYAAVAPRSVDSPGQQALAATAAGGIFVFFDGIAPLESDMTPRGLATPLEALRTFKIP